MKTVCVLDGNLKDRKGFLEVIKKSLVDYEYFEFDKEDTYDYVSQLITEISCFGQRRLYVIKELPKLRKKKKKKEEDEKEEGSSKAKDRAKILNYFKKVIPVIPTGNIVVFDNINISSVSFLKIVKEHGGVKKFPQKIKKADAIKKINAYFHKQNISLDDGVGDLISDSLNFIGDDVDVDKLDLLLIKIHNYVAGKTTITDKDIYAVCSFSKEFIVWALYEIVDNYKDEDRYAEAFYTVMNFVRNARYPQYEATMLLQSMLWRYGLLLIAKSGANNKMSKEELVGEISKIRKLKSQSKAQKIKMSLKEDKPEYSAKMIGSVINRRRGAEEALSCYIFEELLLIYHVISKSLVKIRSGCSVAEITTLLQMVLLTICGELPENDARDRILDHKKLWREAG